MPSTRKSIARACTSLHALGGTRLERPRWSAHTKGCCTRGAGVLGLLLLRRPRQARPAADAEGCAAKALSSMEAPTTASFSSGAGGASPRKAAARRLLPQDDPEAPAARRCQTTQQDGPQALRAPATGSFSTSAGGGSCPKATEVAARRCQRTMDGPETLAGFSSDASAGSSPNAKKAGQKAGHRIETVQDGPAVVAARRFRTQDSPGAPSTPDQASAKKPCERVADARAGRQTRTSAGAGARCAPGAPHVARRNSSTSSIADSRTPSDAGMSIACSGAMYGWDAACDAAAAAADIPRPRMPVPPGLPSGSAAPAPAGTPARFSSPASAAVAMPAGRSPFEAASQFPAGAVGGAHCGRAKSTLTPAVMAPNGSPFAAVLAPAGPGDASYAPPAGGRPLTLERGRSEGENELAAAVRTKHRSLFYTRSFRRLHACYCR